VRSSPWDAIVTYAKRMHSPRRFTRRIVLIAVVIAAVASTIPTASAAPVTVNVGATLTLSGPNAAYGLSSRRGIDLAAKEINAGAVRGVSMKVTTIDDLGTPEGASAAYGVFFRAGVSTIMGPTLSSVALVVNHFAQGARIPVVAVSNTLPGITEVGTFVFRGSLTEQFVTPRVVKAVAMSSLQPKTAVVVMGSDEYSLGAGAILSAALTSNAVILNKTVAIPAGTTDFAAIAAEIKAADPDIVAIGALPADGVPLLIALRNAGYKKKIIGSTSFNSQSVITGAQSAANGLIVGASWSSAVDKPANTTFIKAFKKEYRLMPDQYAAAAYAYTYVVAAAAKNGKSATQESMQTQLAAITGSKFVSTLLGRFRFDSNRNGVSPVVIQEIVNQKFVVYAPK